MKIYSILAQGSEAVEEFALHFALVYDFSECETEDFDYDIHKNNFIDDVNGIEVHYNVPGDYYFFCEDSTK